MLRLLLLLAPVHAVLNANSKEWSYLKAHPMAQTTDPSAIDLDALTADVWGTLVSSCPQFPSEPKLRVHFDHSIANTTVLAYASQNLLLSSKGAWVSTLYSALGSNSSAASYDLDIGINPTPPNGWHVSPDCDGISYRYDLRTVLRHELLHGFILASSVRLEDGWTAGYSFQGNCYPRLYDTKIVDANNQSVVNGCEVADIDGKALFIEGVRVYHPLEFQLGSSFSHHDYSGQLMYYALPSKKCIKMGEMEGRLLSALGVACTIENVTYSAALAAVPGALFATLALIFLNCC